MSNLCKTPQLAMATTPSTLTHNGQSPLLPRNVMVDNLATMIRILIEEQ